MAAKHPYVSTTGVLTQVLDHLQKSFPNTFNAETLKKLGFAPKNESYIVNVVKFLGLVSDDDARTEAAQKVFTLHDASAFQAAFSEVVQKAYDDLFILHKEAAWTLGDDKLIPFFRQTDQTSDLVGSRQASTFRTLAAYAGHTVPSSVTKSSKANQKPASGKISGKVMKVPKKKVVAEANDQPNQTGARNFGLTVRIEVNLPATGDQDTYDKIFRSIRENFLNA